MSNDLVAVQVNTVATVVSDSSANVVVQSQDTYTVTTGAQGPQGPTGPQGPIGPSTFQFTAGADISGHRAVTLINGLAQYASNTDINVANKIAGITTQAASSGGEVNTQKFGEITEPSWNWIVDSPVYLSTNGLLTQTVPTSPAKFIVVVGVATAIDKLFVNIMPPIFII